ncbi:TIGR00366 family protein [Neobacillus cucumis]|uniref:TIGR00366 family protein n=1 Tax=Neobacillus cucumis TaxID=1740721 RepID=UPI00203F359D|nr:TIGR00366 family protein [Neobacillus cucumis]MCM3726624.1 TIGR00366 family protein [Neobacillus cucumis]
MGIYNPENDNQRRGITKQSKANLSLSEKVAEAYSKYFPDSMIFVLAITVISMFLAVILTDIEPIKVVNLWFDGFPWMFTFAFQLILTYAAALVIVETPWIGKQITNVAKRVKKPTTAYVSTALISGFASLLGWYIGPVVAGTYARAIGKTNDKVDYRLLTAITYSSWVVWAGGISATIPLFVATEGPLTDMLGGVIPLEATIFSPMNLILMISTVFTITTIFYFIGKNKKEIVSYKSLLIEAENTREEIAVAIEGNVANETFADRINNWRPILWVIGLLGVAYMFYHLAINGLNGLNLNSIAFLIMFIGFMVSRNVNHYAKSFSKHMAASTSIAIQFPLYGGIASILVGTGLAEVFSKTVLTISTEATFPILTFLMEGFIHLFIPSAGSLFTATGPAFIPAAQELGVGIPRTIMAINYGETWTSLIQPFWALLFMPIMGAGLKLTVKDFLGYCLPILIVIGIFLDYRSCLFTNLG